MTPAQTREPVQIRAAFLRAYPPFDTLDPAEVERVAAAAEPETYRAGATIFAQGADPVSDLRVVREGRIEIVADGRVLDVLGPGALFGHASMLSGYPTGFMARAARDSTCYRIDGGVAQSLLSAPPGLRYVARSLLEEPTELHALAREPARNVADQPVGGMVRGQPAVCAPETAIRDAAGLMGDASGNAVVVDLGSAGFGIVTDRDLRMRVIAAGLSPDAPISTAMSAPAYTCAADRPAGEVLLEMFERGLRHLPVVAADGTILGVVEDVDLVAVRTRSSFYLRQRISRAQNPDELARVAAELGPMVISLHDARVAAPNVMTVYAVCVDALIRRLLELVTAGHGGTLNEFAWLVLGSLARREALPSSDLDSAIVWFGGQPDNEAAVRDELLAVARDVVSGLRACGLRMDENGVNADAAPFVRSLASWQQLARSWIADPDQEKALILSSVIVDSRPVWGVHTGTPVSDTFRLATNYPNVLRLLARFALSHRPPMRRLRGLVVEPAGPYRGRLDLKQGGIVPILDLARWGALAAGVTSASTIERLRAAADAGTLAPEDAHTLRDAFELINNLRLHHQVDRMRLGDAPDDYIDPGELSDLMRVQLRQAFRAVASIQKRVAAELTVTSR
ncbi:MAG: putative nucleotidyltransferase substrate binding domain-containing protein [Solirubrobacteraceae bacterium]